MAAGLLARAEHYLGSTPGITENSFYAWAARFGVQHACVLRNIDGRYIPAQAVGMDAQSLVQACCEKQYWDETLAQTQAWQHFETDDELSPFFQIFSGKYRQELSSLHVLLTEAAILLVVILESEALSLPQAESARACLSQNMQSQQFDSSTEVYAQTVQRGLSNAPAQLLLLSLNLAVEEAIEDCPYAAKAINNALKAAIYAELYAQCKILFQSPNTTHSGSDGEIKIVLFSRNEPDNMLLRFHISQNFRPILGNAAQKVVLLQAGTSNTERGALAFLEQG